ncbi:MAG: hypothetical protein B1H11_09580 [Desulfobacteraceae bacterium 4484_190.1]|nr:MAG: hypothetical protein B1H11_09580 [Desulfobacteraceae bacterium 4484_190.1]
MDKDSNSMTPLKDIITDLFKEKTLPFNIKDARIWMVWDEIVGPSISKNAQPSGINDKKLKVIVSNPIWLQELQFTEESIRNQLNRKLGRKAIRKIDFRVGVI